MHTPLAFGRAMISRRLPARTGRTARGFLRRRRREERDPATTAATTTPRLETGQQADYVGHLAQAQAKDASRLGVKAKTGQPVLQNQGAYVLVSVGDLKLH